MSTGGLVILKIKQLAAIAVATATLAAGAANAANVSFTPDSAPGVALTSPFGQLAPGGELGANYIDFGVDFTFGGKEGYFNDPPLAFCGINGAGNCDLFSDVDGRIVLLGTTTQGVTDYFYAEAGSAAIGSLTLSVYDVFGDLISSVTNDNPVGTFGHTTFSVAAAGIASFRISGNDSYGVNEIRLGSPTAAGGGGVVPEPSTWALMIGGFGMAGAMMRRRRAVAAA